MKKLLLSGLTVTALSVLYALPAHAQATRTWVSGVGDDVNPCSRTAPCKTFAGAISKTAAGGEISVLDPGGFGAVTITKSISLTNDNSGTAGILSSSVNGVIVSAGAADVVNIRGIVIDGAGVTPGLSGIRFLTGGALNVSNCVIKNFTTSPAVGINFLPGASAKLTVTNTVISHNGTGSAGGAINVKPTGGFSSVMLMNVLMDNNSNGLVADATTTTGAILATVQSSAASNNNNSGFAMIGNNGANQSFLTMLGSSSSNNSFGVTSSGSAGNVLISNSVVTGNNTGLSPTASGKITTYLNNVFLGNTAQGSTTATQAGQ